MKELEYPLQMWKPSVVETIYRYYLQGLDVESIVCAMMLEHRVEVDVFDVNNVIDQKNLILGIA